MTALDQSLHQPRVSALKTAKSKGLKAQVRALFVENTLTDASKQRRTCSISQGVIVRSSEQFCSYQNLEIQFQTCEPTNPSENAMYPVLPEARRAFYLEESGQDAAMALLFP